MDAERLDVDGPLGRVLSLSGAKRVNHAPLATVLECFKLYGVDELVYSEVGVWAGETRRDQPCEEPFEIYIRRWPKPRLGLSECYS